MITKYVKKIIVMEVVVVQKDTLKNPEDSKAVWDVGSMKDVPTNTQRKTEQWEINRAVANVSLKHENEKIMLKEEMDNLRLIITNLETHIKSLMIESTKHSEANKEIEIIKEVVSEKIQEKDYVGKELQNVDIEVSNKDEAWLHCDICLYKCKTEKTISKHMNTTQN